MVHSPTYLVVILSADVAVGVVNRGNTGRGKQGVRIVDGRNVCEAPVGDDKAVVRGPQRRSKHAGTENFALRPTASGTTQKKST